MKHRRLDTEVVEVLGHDPDLVRIAEAIASDAPSRRSRRSRIAAVMVVAAIGSAIAVAVFGRGEPSFTDRALAAIGDAPVLHALVTQADASDITVDLETGRQSPVRLSVESWFRPRPYRIHTVTRRNGHILSDTVGAGRVDPALRLFLTGYRRALRDGRLRAGATTTVNGRRVRWLTIVSSRPRERIALDLETYLPLRIQAAASAPWTVVTLESVDPDHVDFSRQTQGRVHPSRGDVVARRITRLGAADRALGWRPVSLGRSFRGLQLFRAAVERVRSDFAAQRRPPRFTTGFALTYRGALGSVEIREAKQPLVAYRFGEDGLTFNFDPLPESGMTQLAWLGSGGWIGQLRVRELFVTVIAPSAAVAVEVARALWRG